MSDTNKYAIKSLVTRVRKKFFSWLHLTTNPVVQVYHGFGNKEHVFIFGHVFLIGSTARKKYRKRFVVNGFAMLASFLVKPFPCAHIQLVWGDMRINALAAEDGYFRFELFPEINVKAGWHALQVHLLHPDSKQIMATGDGLVFIPHTNQYAIISDIDDTFLISHSSTVWKRLYVLLSKNAHSRKPFEDVVKHYKLLATAGTVDNIPNPFFYVSSSEWNLYFFLMEFCRQNQLPKGVYMLSQLKTIRQILQSGQNKHQAKFMKIVRILEAYPEKKFILSGDDSQEDPNIYAAIVKHFPGKIMVVYLRRVHKPNEENVLKQIAFIKSQGVPCCYFLHSREAISHSKEVGLLGSI
ncbi:MAG TPA: App1 family protein [Chitinophagaceae bacterium]